MLYCVNPICIAKESAIVFRGTIRKIDVAYLSLVGSSANLIDKLAYLSYSIRYALTLSQYLWMVAHI
jgi:hypothetical protein